MGRLITGTRGIRCLSQLRGKTSFNHNDGPMGLPVRDPIQTPHTIVDCWFQSFNRNPRIYKCSSLGISRSTGRWNSASLLILTQTSLGKFGNEGSQFGFQKTFGHRDRNQEAACSPEQKEHRLIWPASHATVHISTPLQRHMLWLQEWLKDKRKAQ